MDIALRKKTATVDRTTLLHDYLESIHAELKNNRNGEVASYIPELLNVDHDNFAIVIATVDGHVYQVGDSQVPFSIQSVSKAFTYGMALTDKGADTVLEKVDVEPSGEAFNQISLEEQTGRPKNPMINAGAIAITGLIDGSSSDEKTQRILDGFTKYTGHSMQIDEQIYQSENSTGHRNRAISHMLRNYDIIDDQPEQTLDAYFKQCSILVTCRDLALMAACLANNGVNPITGIRALQEKYIPNVLSVMASCGMYDYSGNWIYNVGMPAKSGVGGGITAVLPGQFGLAIYSPRLDPKGNSVRGIAVCERLSSDLGLHMLRSSRITSSSVIRATYTGRDIHSKRHRNPTVTQKLDEIRDEIFLIELMGELTFVSCELIIREIHSHAHIFNYLIIDFTRITSMDKSAERIMEDMFKRYLEADKHIIHTGMDRHISFSSDLKKLLYQQFPDQFHRFEDIYRAMEFCENSLINRFDPDYQNLNQVSLSSLSVCAEMNTEEITYLTSLCETHSYAAGEYICHEGDPADKVYFLVYGKLSAWLKANHNKRIWLGGSCQGGVFGESALLGNKVRSADLAADTDVVILELDARKLLNDEDIIAQSTLKKVYKNLLLGYDKMLRRATAQIRIMSR